MEEVLNQILLEQQKTNQLLEKMTNPIEAKIAEELKFKREK